jgi:hypothetical protein
VRRDSHQINRRTERHELTSGRSTSFMFAIVLVIDREISDGVRPLVPSRRRPLHNGSQRNGFQQHSSQHRRPWKSCRGFALPGSRWFMRASCIALLGARPVTKYNDRQLSALIYPRVLNQPLYDGGCSQKARALLADGNVANAIDEWRRLADLGSGDARCVLAYIHFRGAPTIVPDLHEARRLANAAAATSRGYANYLLGCFALSERDVNRAASYFKVSYEANFVPVLTALAWIRFRHNTLTGKSQKSAERLALLAVDAGHLPARAVLARIYLSGQLGLLRRSYGALVFPWALIGNFIGARRNIFSVHCFHYSTTFRQSLFVTAAQ